MATLNIKNMPDALYRKLQKRAKQQRRSLAQEVTQILAEGRRRPEAPFHPRAAGAREGTLEGD